MCVVGPISNNQCILVQVKSAMQTSSSRQKVMNLPNTIPNHLREHHLLLSEAAATDATAAAVANHTVHLVGTLVLKLPESPSGSGQSALILNLGSDLSLALIDGNVTAVPTPASLTATQEGRGVAEVPGNPAGCLFAEPDAHSRVPWVWAWAWGVRVAAITLPPPALELLSQSSDSSLVTRSLTGSLETLDDTVDGVGITRPSTATGASQSLPGLLCLPHPYLLPIAEWSITSTHVAVVVIVTAARVSDVHITECSETGIKSPRNLIVAPHAATIERKVFSKHVSASTVTIITERKVAIKDGSTSTVVKIERKVATKDGSTSTVAVLAVARVYHVTSNLT